jgi:hypothetical protein
MALAGIDGHWLFTSNNASSTTTQGRLLDVVKDTASHCPTLNSGTRCDAPCAASVSSVAWSPDGKSIGLARNGDMPANPYIVTGISNTQQINASCPGSDDCVGVGYYDLSASISPNPDQTYNPDTGYANTSSPKPVDVLARWPKVVVADKETGAIIGWDQSTGANIVEYTSATDVSQLVWLEAPYFIASVPKTSSCTSGTPIIGQVWVGHLGDADTTPDAVLDVPKPSGADVSKPEGIAVSPYANDGSCTATGITPDYVIYAGDYCNSRVHIWTVELDKSTTPATITAFHEGFADLDVDADANTFSACQPSSVEYHRENGDVYVLCQTRDSIIRLDTSGDKYSGAGQCSPAWKDSGDQATLQTWTGSSSPTCDGTVEQTDCDGGQSGDCSPHDIAYDQISHPQWLFVNLSTAGEILAIDRDLLDDQIVIYEDSNYMPMELEIQPHYE